MVCPIASFLTLHSKQLLSTSFNMNNIKYTLSYFNKGIHNPPTSTISCLNFYEFYTQVTTTTTYSKLLCHPPSPSTIHINLQGSHSSSKDVYSTKIFLEIGWRLEAHSYLDSYINTSLRHFSTHHHQQLIQSWAIRRGRRTILLIGSIKLLLTGS